MASLLFFMVPFPKLNIGSRGELPGAVLNGWRCGRLKFCFHVSHTWQ